jgi:N-methylhydantoinase A
VPALAIPSPPTAGTPRVTHAAARLGDETAAIPFYERATLPRGYTAAGPCVVEEHTATTFVPPGWRFGVDERGCLDVVRA